jgi:hypothetical protein
MASPLAHEHMAPQPFTGRFFRERSPPAPRASSTRLRHPTHSFPAAEHDAAVSCVCHAGVQPLALFSTGPSLHTVAYHCVAPFSPQASLPPLHPPNQYCIACAAEPSPVLQLSSSSLVRFFPPLLTPLLRCPPHNHPFSACAAEPTPRNTDSMRARGSWSNSSVNSSSSASRLAEADGATEDGAHVQADREWDTVSDQVSDRLQHVDSDMAQHDSDVACRI